MKTREEIITEMCYAARPDFGLFLEGLERNPYNKSVGMTADEQRRLFDQMANQYDRSTQ